MRCEAASAEGEEDDALREGVALLHQGTLTIGIEFIGFFSLQ